MNVALTRECLDETLSVIIIRGEVCKRHENVYFAKEETERDIADDNLLRTK